MSASVNVMDLGEGNFALIVECFDEELVSEFNEMGYDGNGYTWNGVVDSVARLTLGDGASQLSLSPEADSAMAVCPKKDILDTLAAEVRRAFPEPDFMKKVIENADPEELE